MKTRDGKLICLAGASRSGKTAYAARLAKSAPVALAWDPESQWAALPGWTAACTGMEFIHAAMAPGPRRVAFIPPAGTDARQSFELFARAAFAVADRGDRPTVIGEELADVSTPGKALTWWGTLLRRGLKRGATILAISQRWAEADKTALGNATAIVIFRQSSADDVRYLTRKTRVPSELIDALKPLEYVYYDCAGQVWKAGKLRF